MAMHPDVSYIPYATYSKEQTGHIITLAQFEESNLWSETRNDAEIGDESDDDSIIPPLLREEEMDMMDSGIESYDEPMYTEILEDICDGSQYHPKMNRREAHYKIRDRIKQIQSEWKGALNAT